MAKRKTQAEALIDQLEQQRQQTYDDYAARIAVLERERSAAVSTLAATIDALKSQKPRSRKPKAVEKVPA